VDEAESNIFNNALEWFQGIPFVDLKMYGRTKESYLNNLEIFRSI